MHRADRTTSAAARGSGEAAAPTRSQASHRVRSYLSVRDLTAPETLELLETARLMKRERARRRPQQRLSGRTLAMVFQKPSLRTRVSFEVGMAELGGHAIYLGPEEIRLGQRETVEDVALVLSRMADLIMARVFGHEVVLELAKFATVPIINGLSDREHPCQILGDLLTILERKGRLAGLRVVFCGDGNNVVHSLLYAAGLLGMHLTVAGPVGYEPQREIVEEAKAMARESGAVIRVTPHLDSALRGADVVYTDVWTSMGQEAQAEERLQVFRPYQVNRQVMALADPDAILLHCLPAHYGEEIDYATSRLPNSAIFDQAENRLHAQKALMVLLAG